MGVIPRGNGVYAPPVAVNVWNELSVGNVLDFLKKELGCNKVAPIKPEAGAIFFYSYSQNNADKCKSKSCTVTVNMMSVIIIIGACLWTH